MQEALRTYLELAMGLTEVSRKKVKKAVKDAVGKGGATADQLRALSADLLATNSANREALTKLVKFEVDRALGVVGLATAEEVAELTGRVRELERELAAAKGGQAVAPAKAGAAAKAAGRVKPGAAEPAHAVAPTQPVKAEPAKQAPTKKVAAKKVAAKKVASAPAASPAKKATPGKTAPAKTTATKAAPARKTAKKAAKKAQP